MRGVTADYSRYPPAVNRMQTITEQVASAAFAYPRVTNILNDVAIALQRRTLRLAESSPFLLFFLPLGADVIQLDGFAMANLRFGFGRLYWIPLNARLHAFS